MAIQQAYRAGHEGRAGWAVSFDYDQDVIDTLKSQIPARERSYSPDTHTWWFAVEYESMVERSLPDFAAFRLQGQLL